MKKLLLLPILCGSYLNANAQVYNAGTMFSGYVDIAPDTLMNYTVAPYTHELYSLNIFGDAINDLDFIAHGAVSSGGSAAYISVTSINTNLSIRQGRLDSVFVPATSTWNVTSIAKPLNIGEAIDPAGAVWNNTTLYLTDHSGSGGGNKNVNDFVGGDKYLGLRYVNGTAIAYGWVRVQCPTQDACYVKDYSFTPETVGINESAVKETVIFPNPVSDHFFISNLDPNTFSRSSLKIRDIYGKEIGFSCDPGTNTKITFDKDIAEGYYILQYNSGNDIFSQKIVKVSR
jgi:hypothetical protein